MVCSYGLINRLWEFIMVLLLSVRGQESSKQAVHWKERDHSETIGDQASRLLSVYGNSVLRLAYSYLHNMSDAEDVLQDTLIQFLKSQPEFESEAHEKAWILPLTGISLLKLNIQEQTIPYH